MKPMRKHAALWVFAAILLSSCSDRPDQKDAAARIDAIVARIKGRDAHATEYPDTRKYHYVDINGDGVPDVVALFTVEGFGGGNNYSFYLSVLRNNKGVLAEVDTVKAGGKGERELNFDTVRLKQGTLELDTKEYAPDDPMCCPSRAGIARFAIAGGIREIARAH